MAIITGNIGFLRFLVHRGYRFPHDIIAICLHRTKQSKQLAVCQYLLSLGYQTTGLRHAVRSTCWGYHRDLKLIEILLNHSNGFSKLTMRDCLTAAMYSRGISFDILSLLLRFGTKETSNGVIPGPFLRYLVTCQFGQTGMLFDMLYPGKECPQANIELIVQGLKRKMSP